jgi:hypothetical protein
MITLEEFNRMPMLEKAEYTWSFGTFLLNKEYDDLSTRLYALDGFFVEIWIDYMALVHIKSFRNSCCDFQKYLNDIDLTGLVQA